MYLCVECELNRLKSRGYDTKEQAQNSEWANKQWCRACKTNTEHVAVHA